MHNFGETLVISRSLYKKSSGIFMQWWILDPFFMTVYSCIIHSHAIFCKELKYNKQLSALKARNTTEK